MTFFGAGGEGPRHQLGDEPARGALPPPTSTPSSLPPSLRRAPLGRALDWLGWGNPAPWSGPSAGKPCYLARMGLSAPPPARAALDSGLGDAAVHYGQDAARRASGRLGVREKGALCGVTLGPEDVANFIDFLSAAT